MALDKDILGAALWQVRKPFSNKTWQQLLDEYGDADGIGLAISTADAETIINHFKTAGVVNVNVTTTGTATAQSGTGTGTIE